MSPRDLWSESLGICLSVRRSSQAALDSAIAALELVGQDVVVVETPAGNVDR